MKTFNAADAMLQKPTVTREGLKPVDLTYYPTTNMFGFFINGVHKLVNVDGKEFKDGTESPFDLFMQSEVTERYINVFRDSAGGLFWVLYENKELAISDANDGENKAKFVKRDFKTIEL